VSSVDPPARMQIALSLVQQTRTREFFGHDGRLYVFHESPGES